MSDTVKSASSDEFSVHNNCVIDRSLDALRLYLKMDLVSLVQVMDDSVVVQAIIGKDVDLSAMVDKVLPLENSFASHILNGTIPQLMNDLQANPIAAQIPMAKFFSFGAMLGVPIHLSDGSLFGILSCFSMDARPDLNVKDLELMHVFNGLIAERVEEKERARRENEVRHNRITGVLKNDEFNIVFQPIWSFAKLQPIGFEALSRFVGEPYRTPDVWFREADEAGLGLDLEVATIAKALGLFREMPESCYLSLNASPDTVLSGVLENVIDPSLGSRILLEITEHAPIEDYEKLLQKLGPLRRSGMKLAIDDVGAGYASLKHIVQLAPDVIKLDMSLTRDIDSDRTRRSLANALIYFARETNAKLIAEGVETQSELDALRLLGVSRGQGYLLGRPANIRECEDYFIDKDKKKSIA